MNAIFAFLFALCIHTATAACRLTRTFFFSSLYSKISLTVLLGFDGGRWSQQAAINVGA